MPCGMSSIPACAARGNLRQIGRGRPTDRRLMRRYGRACACACADLPACALSEIPCGRWEMAEQVRADVRHDAEGYPSAALKGRGILAAAGAAMAGIVAKQLAEPVAAAFNLQGEAINP